MPNYGVTSGGSMTALYPGQSKKLFDAETPTAPQASIAIARHPGPLGSPSGIVFQIHFDAAPTAVVQIQGSNVDEDAQYQTLETLENLQDAYYADGGGFAFYRAVLYSGSGTLTVIAQR